MTIKIPDTYMGKPVKGAMELILSAERTPSARRKKGKNTSQSAPSPSNFANAKDYIILEARQHGSYSYPDTLVPMEKSHFGKDWNKTHEDLTKEGAYMLTIRQFADFLNLLKSGKAFDGTGKLVRKEKLESVFNEIVEVRDPWRSEWLDAKFEGGSIIYHTLNGNNLEEINEPLANYIKTDKIPGISLDDWLKRANYQGLPVPKTNKGRLCYWAPADGSVAGFYADSGRVDLDCGRNPVFAGASLGVRSARVSAPSAKI